LRVIQTIPTASVEVGESRLVTQHLAVSKAVEKTKSVNSPSAVSETVVPRTQSLFMFSFSGDFPFFLFPSLHSAVPETAANRPPPLDSP
ncbi:hypothetical protein A2U01_0070170, partial [Trifolium medium]|nr:hypothetical protein [Trifolium medium]